MFKQGPNSPDGPASKKRQIGVFFALPVMPVWARVFLHKYGAQVPGEFGGNG